MLLGVLLPLTRDGDAAAFRASLDRALARHRGPRPVGLVLCDDSASDPDAPWKAGLHLRFDLKVPAVIGFRNTAEAMSLAKWSLEPALVVLAREDDPLAGEPPRENVWRPAFDSPSAARAIAGAVRAQLRGASAPRIAIVHSPTANTTFLGALGPALDGAGEVRSFVYAGLAGENDPMTEALGAYAPHAVIVATDRSFFPQVAALLDAREVRPRYFALAARETPRGVTTVRPALAPSIEETIAHIDDAIQAIPREQPVTGIALAKAMSLAKLDPTTHEAVGLVQEVDTADR